MRAVLFLVIFAFATKCSLSATITSNNIYKLENVNPAFVNRIFERELNETLECLRYTLETGLPEIDLPSLASIEIPDLNIDLEALGLEGTSGYFHISGGVLRGLTSFYATDLSTSITLVPVGISIDITLVLSEFYLELDYDMDMIVDGMPIYGDGIITIDWRDVNLGIKFVVGFTDTVEISGVNILISLGSSQITITGWFNDEEHSQVVTDLVNDYLIPHWINAQTEEINEVLGPVIEVIANLLIFLIDLEGGGGDLNASLDAIINHCALRPEDIQLFLK